MKSPPIAADPERRPPARILVVDDEPTMVRTVERILETEHEVRGSTVPSSALALAEGFRPHLAILDIRMADMDGFALMRALKKLDPRMRVILMTGSAYGTDDKLIRAIREEAFYYVNKPFDRGVLRTLVDRCLQLRHLEDAHRQHLEHLESQLEEARVFQQTMLPDRRASVEGFELDALYRPCTELAGDLYDYAAAGTGRVALVIADVVGHGASAAMLTAIVKAAFRSSHAERFDPLAIVERVADGIVAFEADRFVTLLCVRIDARRGRLHYVNAGHSGGLLLTPGAPPAPLASTGPLISPVVRHLGWQRTSLAWAPESRLVLYTDGIPEATAGGDEQFGVERLHALLADRAGSGGELLAGVLGEVDAFTGGRAADDDQTLLTVRRAG